MVGSMARRAWEEVFTCSCLVFVKTHPFAYVFHAPRVIFGNSLTHGDYLLSCRSRVKIRLRQIFLKNKVVGRVDHPQTNGKVEKFFDIFEKKVKFFNSVDEFMNWYNFIRPHGAFDIEKLESQQ